MVVLKSTETEIIATWSLSEIRTKTSYVSHSLYMYSKKLWGSIILSVCRQLMEKTCFQTEDNIDRLNLSSKIAYLFGYCISTALHFTKYHICVCILGWVKMHDVFRYWLPGHFWEGLYVKWSQFKNQVIFSIFDYSPRRI